MTNAHPLTRSTGVPVSRRALEQRINRKLAPDGEVLRRKRSDWCRYGRGWNAKGDYYLLDLNTNFLVDEGFDLEDLGRELGVLQAYETLVTADDEVGAVSPEATATSGG